MISLASVEIPLKAYFNVLKCLVTKRIGQGSFIKEFEERIKELFGVKYCIATCNGTMADTVMLLALSEMYPNRKNVIVPALTFPAQTNAILLAGLNPIFVPIDSKFRIMWEAVKPDEDTLCVFPVHLLGNSASIPKEYAKRNVPILEDCCEAMLGYDSHGLFGKFGIAGSFSMFPSHLVTTGEGGFIITDNQQFATLVRSIINHGKASYDFEFGPFGTNSKWNNLSAAIGCSVLSKADEYRKQRMKNFQLFNSFLQVKRDIPTSPHSYPYICKSEEERNQLLIKLKQAGVEARRFFPCIPDMSSYIKRFGFTPPDKFYYARLYERTGILIPVHHQLTKAQIERTCRVITG